MTVLGSKRLYTLCLAALCLAAPVRAEAPLSASDWLSGSIKMPEREVSSWHPGDRPPPHIAGGGNSLPVASSAAVGAIEVTRLDRADPDKAGTITARSAGISRDLWQGSEVETLHRLILNTPARLPAMNALMRRILTAQLRPPSDATGQRGRLFLARVDRLLDMGALDEAEALLVTVGHGDAGVFRRLFDVTLLEGDESRACQIMDNTPGIAPSFAARIFCLAQSGDWAAAAIGFYGAEELGLLSRHEVQLLTHFLHDSYVDSGEQLEPSDPITPLEFRILEAVGQPLPTRPLPLAFAHSDLRANTGWKARLEAAERLARAGAIPADRLRQTYSEQKPAASGGIWDRAEAMADIEAALAQGDITPALPAAFNTFRRAGMADVLAAMLATDLPTGGEGEGAEIAALLRQFQGLPVQNPLKADATLKQGTPPPPRTRQGETLLTAMADIDAGIDGDLVRAAAGLATLRALGLDADADLAVAQLGLLPHFQETR